MSINTSSGRRVRGSTAIALAVLVGLFAIAAAIYFRPDAGRWQWAKEKEITAILDTATGNFRMMLDGKWREVDSRP